MIERPTRRVSRPDSGVARKCPFDECDGGGLVVDESTNTAAPCRCRESLIGRAITRRSNTGVPKRFQGVSLDRKPLVDLDKHVRAGVEAFIEGLDTNIAEGHGLWCYGDVGTGKSSLLMLIGQKALKAGHSVAIYSLPQLINQMQATYDTASQDSYSAVFERLCSVDLLVLDDFGSKYRYTEWVSDQLFSIVNERWQDQASIVLASTTPTADDLGPAKEIRSEIAKLQGAVTSGSLDSTTRAVARLEAVVAKLDEIGAAGPGDSFARIRNQLDPRTYSRLAEICNDLILPVMGPDLRIEHAA
jgi:DNA replication protein DnaC